MAIDFPNSPAPGTNHTVDGKTWTYTDGKWALNVGVGGVQGPAGVAIQGTAPATTDVLWADTSDTGLIIVPAGGTTGQVLAKSSSASYDTAWATPVTSGDMALKANLASPTFTGTPTLPSGTIATTQSAGNNTTAVATTAFVTASNAIYSGKPLKIYSNQANLTQKIYAATGDTLDNITTYVTNPLATSYLLITIGVAYELNTSSDAMQIGFSINGVDQFSFSDSTLATTYNEFPYYTFRSINSYTASSSISNIRTYVKGASGQVVCPRTTGGPLNFSITIQEYAA